MFGETGQGPSPEEMGITSDAIDLPKKVEKPKYLANLGSELSFVGTDTDQVVNRYVEEFGREAVSGEINDMIYDDMADRALEAADAIGDEALAICAARVVTNSGSYDKEKLADLMAKYPSI